MEKAKIPDIAMRKDDIEALREQYIQKLKDDKDIYAKIQSLKLTSKDVRSNLGVLMDYQEDFDYCKNCPGLDKCAKDTPQYAMDITFDGRFVDRRYNPCKKVVDRLLMSARYLIRDFDDEWMDKGMADIDKTQRRNPLITNLIDVAIGKSRNWIYVRGKIKSGRSYILACFSNTYASQGHVPCAFADTAKLTEELKGLSINDKAGFQKRFDALCSCPLLILDDFGNEFKSDFAFSNLLFPLINTRSKNDLVTMFTSDFTIDEIGEMYSQKVAPARGRQFSDILKAMCKEYVLDGIAVYS